MQLLSTYTTKINESIDFYGGIDFRYYKRYSATNEIPTFTMGEYYTDSYYRSRVKLLITLLILHGNMKSWV